MGKNMLRKVPIRVAMVAKCRLSGANVALVVGGVVARGAGTLSHSVRTVTVRSTGHPTGAGIPCPWGVA